MILKVDKRLETKWKAEIVKLSPYTKKDTFMQMLLHLNDDFDDDLLLDALEILNCCVK